MKINELKTAKFLLDKLVKEYPSMFDKDDGVIHIWDRNSDKLKTTPTNAKDDIKLIRRLLMEVAKEL